jgi:hypothetical protein
MDSGPAQEAHPGMTAPKGVGYVPEHNVQSVHAIAIIGHRFSILNMTD